MRKTLLLVSLLAAYSSQAQKSPNPKRYAQTITGQDLKKHLYIVAGEEMQGRETATEGQRKAAAYIENEFRRIGLLPANQGSFQMDFSVYQDSLEKATLAINGKDYNFNSDFSVHPANYSTTLYAGEVIFTGRGLSDSSVNSLGENDMAGKVLMVWNTSAGTSSNGNRRRSPGMEISQTALKLGAAAVLVVQSNFPRSGSNNKGNQTLNNFRRINYPNTYYISEQVAKDILGSDWEAAKNGNAQPKSYPTRLLLGTKKAVLENTSSNVIGFIEGSDKKDEYLVLSAHYDHLGKRGDSVIYYGADDDGSGTVSIIEIAEAFMEAKKAGKGPRRSIVFMAVSGEEKGLWGSAVYSDQPVFPLEKTTANLNIDMIGRIDPKRKQGDSTNYVYVVGDDKLSTDLRPISEAANRKYTKLELDYKYNDPKDTERIYYRSDHYNFAKKGVPIIFYFNGTHNDYHRPTDTPDKINYDLMEKRARFIFYTAWEMANRNEMLKRDLKLEAVGTR